MAVKVCKALSAAISLCCGRARDVSMQACETEIEESSVRGAHSLSHRAPVPHLPLQWRDLGRVSSLHLFPQAEQLPQWSTLLHILHPRNGHRSDPLISLRFSLLFIRPFVCFHSLAFRRQMRVELLIASNIWRFADSFFFFFLIPRELEDQPGRLRLLVWKKYMKQRRCFKSVRHCSCSIAPDAAVHLKCVKATPIIILKCDVSGKRTVFLVHLSIWAYLGYCAQTVALEIIYAAVLCIARLHSIGIFTSRHSRQRVCSLF